MLGWTVTAALAAVTVVLGWRLRRQRARIRRLGDQVEARRESDSREPLVVDASGDALEALAAQIDLTRQAQQSALADARRREQRLRQEMANISHDLRTPMIADKGYLQLLERDGPQASPERMNTVLARVDDLSRLVDEFFELSVLDSDDHELTIERVDATALVSQTLLGHRAHLSVRGVAPRVSLPPRSVMVMADRTALTRVVTNLVSNGLVHGDGGLRVELSADRGLAVLVVANRAPEVHARELARLFERSYRTDPARRGPHAGLGLSIVAELVARMDGTVEASLEDDELVLAVALPLAGGGDQSIGS